MRLLVTTLLAGLIFMVLPTLSYAQTGSLSGTVTEATTGDPLPGATVIIEDLGLGTSTDADGRYAMTNIPEGTHSVSVTFVGFRTVERDVEISSGATASLDVALDEDVLGLEDVVVVGYAQIPKREVTGSIASVQGRDVDRLDVQSPDQAMQGRLSGVRVTNTSGQPGGGVHVRIRGMGSIEGGNDPLYIVDGVPISFVDQSSQASTNPLAGINPRDIESIEVLKDAAAASIYGAQASNGVVLITTKRGQAGRTQFNVSASTGAVSELKRHEVIEGPEWAQLQYEAFEWWGEFFGYTDEQWQQTAADNLGGITYEEATAGDVHHSDWQDALMRTGINRKVDISATGGSEDTQFYISGGYEVEEGTGINTDFNRLSLRSNFDHTATDFLTFDLNVNLSRSHSTGTLADGFYLGSPFYAGQRNRPTDPIYNEDGSFNKNTFNNYNAVEVNELDDREALVDQLVTRGAATFNILPWLSFRSTYGVDYRNTRDSRYDSPESSAGEPLGYLFEADRTVLNYTTNQIFNFNGSLGEGHEFRGLAGFEYRHEDRQTISAAGEGFPSGLFRTLQNAADPYSVDGFGSEFKIASFLSQLQYDLLGRYSFSGNLRYDGSSRFGVNTKWGFFPSLGIAWTLSEEPFLAWSTDYLDDLKLRFSYGLTGNTSGIGNFEARQLFGSGGTYAGISTLRPTSLGNMDLTWESGEEINVGLDWTLYGGRLYGALDVYRRDTKNLLLERDIPNDSGFSNLIENVGSVRNEGVEFEVGAILVEHRSLQWTSDFNITFHRNEVLELFEGEDRLGTDAWVGQPLAVQFMYRYAGVNPATGKPMFWDRDGNITYQVNSDVEEGDRTFVGNTQPAQTGGWNNRIRLGGFTLDALVQFNLGQMTYDSFQGSFTDGAFFRRGGLIANTRNRWQEPGDVTSVERAYINSAYPDRTSGFTTSTRFQQNASYIRLKNVRLGYDIPSQWANVLGIDNSRIYVQATNLHTITDYPGIDPEVVGENNAIYPQPRTVTTGIELSF